MRMQFMNTAMKLKLGLYHPLHQGHHTQFSDSGSLRSGTKDKRRPCIRLEHVIKNTHESTKSTHKSQFTFFEETEMKKLLHSVVDMPNLKKMEKREGDFISSQARQIKTLKDNETGRHVRYNKQLTILKDWEESFRSGNHPDRDPDNNLEDIIKLKQLSKLEFCTSRPLRFRTNQHDQGAPTDSITEHSNLPKLKLISDNQTQSVPKFRERLEPISAETRKILRKSEEEGLTERHPNAKIQHRQIKPKERHTSFNKNKLKSRPI